MRALVVVGWSLLILALAGTSSTLLAQKKKRSEETVTATKQRESEFYFTDGEKYFILEDYAKALLYYQKALEATPNNGTIYYRIAEVLAKGGRSDDLTRAALSIEQAIRLEKSNKYFYILAGSIYGNMARFDKAAAAYEQMIKEVKGADEYLYDLAKLYQLDKRNEEALATYDRAESIFGVNEISCLEKIRIYLGQGKSKEVVDEGKKLIDAYPGEERYAMAIAETLSQNGKTAEAIQLLEAYISSDTESANSKMLLAGLYRDANREPEARELLIQVFDNPEVELGSKIIVLGAYNMELNQAARAGKPDIEKATFASRLYEKLVEQYPAETNVHIVGGDLYLSLQKTEEAIAAYRKATESGDVSFEVWQNLLYSEMQLNRLDAVLQDADHALELYPNQGILHYFYGYASYLKHNYPQAATSLEQARLLLADNSMAQEVNNLLGDTYNALGQHTKSDAAYEEVLKVNPGNESALNNYSYFLALRKQNLEKAEKMSAQLVKQVPNNPTYLDTYAWVLYMREKYREARKQMEIAIGTGRANSTHFEHYGDILFKLGDVNGAVTQWEKAKGLDANNESLDRKIANRKIYE